ncbi:MAG: plasmid pRiA4b ORF-3 family protein [Prevotellaceae bacterium]|nr:plasmid pRiA4b ORF-3 family protein [Prevotellaceae bacterium]
MTFPDAAGFKREYDVSAEQTLYDFHRYIQRDLDYDEAQPVLFFTADKQWAPQRKFALMDIDEAELMDEVSIGSLVRAGHHRLLYLFDVLCGRSFRVELLELLEAAPRARYPRLAAESGEPPVQVGKANHAMSAIFDQAMPDVDVNLYSSSSD